jgi:hypothetical protein
MRDTRHIAVVGVTGYTGFELVSATPRLGRGAAPAPHFGGYHSK